MHIQQGSQSSGEPETVRRCLAETFECASHVAEARESDDAGLPVRILEAPAQKSRHFCDEMGRAIMQEEDPQI